MKSTTRFSKNKRGIECLNCKQPISDKDNFCSECGQINDTSPISIKQFITEFFSGFFSFDTRFFKTFIPLLFKPGKVSKEYIEGKRKKYMNPFRLYINVSIVFFLLQGLFAVIDEYYIEDYTTSLKTTQISSDSILMNKAITNNQNNLAQNDTNSNAALFSTKANEAVKNISSSRNIKQKLFSRIDSIFYKTEFLEKLKNDSISKEEKDSLYGEFYKSTMSFISFKVNNNAKNDNWEEISTISSLTKDANTYVQNVFIEEEINYYIPDQYTLDIKNNIVKTLLGNKINNFTKYIEEHPEASAANAINDLGLEKTRWNAFYFKIAHNINKFIEDASFRSSYFKSVISKTSIALFFLLPIFTLFLALLYYRHKWNYTEHLVFVFNVQTVFFLLLICFTIFNRIFKTDVGNVIFILVFLFYLERALHHFYKQHWFKTFIKFLMLNTIYITLAAIGSVLVSFIAFVL